MPPRFAYWTIIAGGLPTAFRAAEREELLPTFTRLKEKQPDAEMKWFARGKLWNSPEDARQHRDHGRAPSAARSGDQARGRDWRPGGDHRDPRQPFKDAKKARNQRFKAEKFARKTRDWTDRPPKETPQGDRPIRPTGPAKATGPTRPTGPAKATGPTRPTGPATATRPTRPTGPARATGPAARPVGPARPYGDSRRDPRERPRDERPRDLRTRDEQPRREGGGDRREWSRDTPRTNRPGDRGGSNRDWSATATRPTPHGDKLTGSKLAKAPRPRGTGDRSSSFTPRGESFRPGHKPFRPRNDSRPRQDHRESGSKSGEGPNWKKPPRAEGREPFRGQGHGDNSWKPRPPRDDRDNQTHARRPFAPRGFERDRMRGSGGQESPSQPPRRPNREPRPNENPKPTPPPRPSEPVIPPPGPPERGRLNRNKRPRR